MSDEVKNTPSPEVNKKEEVKKEAPKAKPNADAKAKVAAKKVPPKPQIVVAPKEEPKEDWQKNILKELGDNVKEAYVSVGEFNVVIENNENYLDSFQKIKDFGFDYLADISSVDYLKFEGAPKRFGLSYHFYSVKMNKRMRVKVFLDDGEKVPSVMDIWKTADFHEREAYDLMGIVFTGRDNLKRILLPDDWVGHPLRKDESKIEGREEYTARLVRKLREED
ncbi:NADH-quinone oxidoreductase subunit C [Thermotomaculum hydrothermale]|uniref:NADH-quinone oxidoreductase subunit C n=1 Tax=Thermotomaculum hydrothermale TaxID=981385 RepID=A0A7R6SZX0_9BACT|nr:NADH-quinone oxidoreductase subunit C [Thermotomaculum hydrothermale]BBB33225.1 NADH-quinone oxidoreductase subunit C [Thermotomaculum hydrothermale]